MMKYLKHIPLEGAYNIRDLGGYPTREGFSTKWGLLYRGDALYRLTEKDWQVLLERNIHAVIDLRSKSEMTVNPIITPINVVYEHYSLMQELDDIPMGNPNVILDENTIGTNKFIESMKLDYSKTLFDNLTCCVDILNAITEHLVHGSVIFACTAGKDRTGIIAAVILYLCSVNREDIIADYIVSSTYNTNGVNKTMGTMFEKFIDLFPDPLILEDCIESRPETIIRLLDDMDKKNLKLILSKNGFDLKKQQKLITTFVE